MKKAFLTLLLFSCTAIAFSQDKRAKARFPEYNFTVVKQNPITPVKNQASSGTCWAFSSIGFIESEIIRINGIKNENEYPDLSEFFVVAHSYSDRAEKYVRLDGALGFSAGSEGDDVLAIIRDYGMVPNSEMTGMNYGTSLPRQAELDAVLKAYVNAIVKNPNKTLSTAWKRGFDAVVAAYLGNYPEKFTVNGKEYTPQSYRDALKFNPDDYVSLTSFTHHPFYTRFPVEVCDNWRWSESYNIPIDELMQNIDCAIENGYTIEWGADVSTRGFTRDGLGILVDPSSRKTSGSDQEHWVGKEDGAPAPVEEPEEMTPTQDSRQTEFDNKTMTDDHGMQIYGIAKDQNGKKYYMVKNSWGVTGRYDGIWYVTEAFVKAQTLNVTVHKSALLKDTRKRLDIK